MNKIFTLQRIEEEKISDKSGTMTFHLIDENGDKRMVSGTTYLDENGTAKGISSENKRELPLIQNLFEMEEKETIDLEFKYYNQVFDRELNKTVNELAYEKVLEMEKEKKLSYRFKRFFRKFKPSSSSEQSSAV